MCEIHSGTFCLSWIWMLYCSGWQPARRRSVYLLQEMLCPGLQSRRAWPAREETAQPGARRDNPHTHSPSFTIYYSLSFWAEARTTDSAEKVAERRYLERENYLEVNNRNSRSSPLKLSSSVDDGIYRPRQRGCLTEVLQFPEVHLIFAWHLNCIQFEYQVFSWGSAPQNVQSVSFWKQRSF